MSFILDGFVLRIALGFLSFSGVEVRGALLINPGLRIDQSALREVVTEDSGVRVSRLGPKTSLSRTIVYQALV